jgi:hypothetical protein
LITLVEQEKRDEEGSEESKNNDVSGILYVVLCGLFLLVFDPLDPTAYKGRI